jgi:hypothetical protein
MSYSPINALAENSKPILASRDFNRSGRMVPAERAVCTLDSLGVPSPPFITCFFVIVLFHNNASGKTELSVAVEKQR